MSTYTMGPANGTLSVNTTRQGVAARVGHDLLIEVAEWDATLTTGDGEPSFELRADPTSLQILEGKRGAKPLSDGDRKKIRKNIDDDVLKGKPIRFRTAGAGSGELELNGTTKPAAVTVSVGDDGAVRGSATLVQSDWGIKPYTGLMGALKVADEVEIAFEGRLP